MENAEQVDDRGQSRSSDEMDHSKIDNFSKTHQGESFPKFRSLSSGECAVVRTRVLALLHLGPDASGLDILKALHGRDGRHLGEVSLEQPVDLRELLRGLPLVAHHQVFLNWHHFDEIDVIDVDDLSKNFDDIWYPSVDDIEIFDESQTWFLSVSHDGRLTLLEP